VTGNHSIAVFVRLQPRGRNTKNWHHHFLWTQSNSFRFKSDFTIMCQAYYWLTLSQNIMKIKVYEIHYLWCTP